MRGSVWLAAFGLTLGVVAGGCNDPTKGQTIFQAQLAGANEVPARSSSATGAAGFTLDGNTVHFSVEVEGLTDIIACHIHVGPAGVSGPVRVPLCSASTPGVANGGVVNGVLVQGTFTAANVIAISFDDLLNAMRSGNAYVNVHTKVYPAGEIRGQVSMIR
jgi:CHRD domain